MITQPKFKFDLKEEVRDKVTGYSGLITGRTEWLYGCCRYSVQSKGMKDGHPVEAMGFDEMALERVKKAPKGRKIQRRSGGPHAEPTRAPSTVARR